MPSSPLSRWRTDLARDGFRPLGTGGRKGTYLGREVGPLQQAIGVLISDDRGGAFNIQLNLNLPLRCAEPPHQVVILEADLGPTEVRVRPPGVHDPALITWWTPERHDDAWQALRSYALPWFDRHADLSELARYFEAAYVEAEEVRVGDETPSWLVALGRRFGLLSTPQHRAHYQYLLWLALIYEALEDPVSARGRLEAYAQATSGRRGSEESARLDRHRAALEDTAV